MDDNLKMTMESDRSVKRSLEYAARLCSSKNEGVYIVYDSSKTDKMVNEFYLENGLDYNYVYFEWEDSYYCFETNGYIPLQQYRSFNDDFIKYHNVIDVSVNGYENDYDGFYFILRSDINKIIFNVQRQKGSKPIRLEIIPTRLILLRSFPVKDNMIDIDRYFQSKIRYHNGKVFPKVEIGYCNRLYWLFVFKKGSNVYVIKEELDSNTLNHLNEIMGKENQEFLIFQLKNEKIKENQVNDSCSFQIGHFNLILNGKQVTYQFRSKALAVVDYDDVSVFSIIDDRLFCMYYGYRIQKNVDRIVKDVKMMGIDVTLYENKFKAISQFDLNELVSDCIQMSTREIDDMQDGLEKDMVVAYNQFRKNKDLSITDLFDYYTNLKLFQYGFDTPLKDLLVN